MLHVLKQVLLKIKVKMFFVKNNIKASYSINDDLSVDVDDYVDLNGKGICEFPFQFGTINGGFDCSNNHLVNLKNCPKVVKGRFSCKNNPLKTLEFSPNEVYGSFVLTGSDSSVSNITDVNGLYGYLNERKYSIVAPWFKMLPNTYVENFLVIGPIMLGKNELKGLLDAKSLAKRILDLKEDLDWSLNISKSIPHKPFKL